MPALRRLRSRVSRGLRGIKGAVAPALRPALAVAGVTLAISLALSLLVLLWRLVSPATPSERTGLLAVYAQVALGLGIAGGLVLAWRRLEVAQQGQITDRFSRAVEHLGSDKLDVRLGGVYALERIAKDSERDHWPVMEVLTAFVREHAPRAAGPPAEGAPTAAGPPAGGRVRADIQAILTVLGRRDRGGRREEGRHLDLADTYLREARLDGAYLREARLDGADLQGAWLMGANLEQVLFVGAKLRNVTFTMANLRGANLTGADLQGAVFYQADLQGARLEGTDLRGVDLSTATGLTPEQVASARTGGPDVEAQGQGGQEEERP